MAAQNGDRCCRSLSMACARLDFRKNERSTVFGLKEAMPRCLSGAERTVRLHPLLVATP